MLHREHDRSQTSLSAINHAEPTGGALVLGDLEFIVLELLSADALYGLEILRAVTQVGAYLGPDFNFRASHLHPTLRGLERGGLIRAERRPTDGTVERVFYTITARGRTTLESL